MILFILQVIVAWVALDIIFAILWAWKCQPTLDARLREANRRAEEKGEK